MLHHFEPKRTVPVTSDFDFRLLPSAKLCLMLPAQQKFWFLIEFIVAGGVITLISIPLILRKVAPNRWYGFRTPSTLGDPAIWYPANEQSGKRLAGAGITILVGAIGFYFVPRWQVTHYCLAVLGVTVISL